MSYDTSLPITHTSSTTLTSYTTIFTLNNVLYVPNMTKNLISISQFCYTNNTFIEFLLSSFLVKDLCMGAILLKGQTKDEVYEWLFNSITRSFLLIVFSSVKTTPFE